MGRGVVAGGISAVAACALLLVSTASARSVDVHVKLRDSNGYGMSLDGHRGGRGLGGAVSIILGAQRSLAPDAPEPLEALATRAAAAAPTAAKLDRAASRRREGALSLQVSTRHAISAYGVGGTVTRKTLFGRFDGFGRVFLHFHPKRKRTLHLGCVRVPMRFGTFSGRLLFTGEDEYVHVDTDKARGRVVLPPRNVRCLGRTRPSAPTRSKLGSAHRPTPKRERYTVLAAEARNKFFAALKETGEASVFFANLIEERGPVLIDRFGYALGRSGEFTSNKRLTRSHVAPRRKPFDGIGDFHGKRKWTGSLTASFPGAPGVSLAGGGFRAELERYPAGEFFD